MQALLLAAVVLALLLLPLLQGLPSSGSCWAHHRPLLLLPQVLPLVTAAVTLLLL